MLKTAPASQTPEQLATALEAFLAEYPNAVISEDGKVLFDMREARYSLSTEHNRCTLHLWSEDRNLVRRISAAEPRTKTLRLTTHKFGQTQPKSLELAGDKDRRSPSTREASRTRFVKVIERVLARHFDGWKAVSFRTAMDLEKSFGPSYARGLLSQAQRSWAVIAVNDEESPSTIDGILTFGILWLQACRDSGSGRRIVPGLKIIVPTGFAMLTLSRLAWLTPQTQWELYELNAKTEELTLRDPADHGNLTTRLDHAPNPISARERFATSAAQVLALVPTALRDIIEQRLRTPTELAFLLHGLEFARIRIGSSAESFNRIEEITFGAGPSETILTADSEPALRDLIARLCERRSPTGDKRDPLFRMQPERWLEGQLRRDLSLLTPSGNPGALDPAHVYSQVPAFAANDRGMLDLLSVTADGRLAVIEVKANEDPQLALQGLDYWVRVRTHHAGSPAPHTGLGEFQRHGYFGGIPLSSAPPRLFLVAPALRIHPATAIILRFLSPRVEWTLIALDERWRTNIKIVWRKRSTDQPYQT